MSIPIFVLLVFAGWTLFTLCIGVGAYRWILILAGRASIGEWRADTAQGSDWYRRAMRAHANCVENLPVFGALVVALMALKLHSTLIDALSLIFLACRIGQTSVHLAPSFSGRLAAIRFALFFVQIVCMVSIAALIFLSSTSSSVRSYSNAGSHCSRMGGRSCGQVAGIRVRYLQTGK
jgi:uncharacterized MAPEG superfamily protein